MSTIFSKINVMVVLCVVLRLLQSLLNLSLQHRSKLTTSCLGPKSFFFALHVGKDWSVRVWERRRRRKRKFSFSWILTAKSGKVGLSDISLHLSLFLSFFSFRRLASSSSPLTVNQPLDCGLSDNRWDFVSNVRTARSTPRHARRVRLEAQFLVDSKCPVHFGCGALQVRFHFWKTANSNQL